MRTLSRIAADTIAALTLTTALALAALPIGAKAPVFTAQASIGGKVFTFNLAQALKHGPVVLYFYPAAFSPACTIEAHEFAAAIGQYRALGATVIGISHDSIATLNRFSVSACRKRFPVAADPNLLVARSYDAVLHPLETPGNRTSYIIAPNGTIIYTYTNRTSYVIAPDDRIIYTYTNLDPSDHVKNTLAALRAWERNRKP